MKLFINLLLLIMSLNAAAQDVALVNKNEVLKSIKITSSNTISIVADFVQTKRYSYLQEPLVSSGKFYHKAESMRWEQEKPYKYIMLVSEQGLKIKNEDKEKSYGAMAEKFVTQIQKILQTSINADFENNRDFDANYLESPKYYKIVLTPTNRQLKKLYKSIELQFSKDSYRLKILSFIEEQGRSDIKFINEKFNSDIETSIFTQF